MELPSNGISDTNTNPSKPVIRVISATKDKAAMIILENKLEELRKSSLQKSATETPHQVLQKRLANLASALVHEVRNPLANINLSAEILESGTLNEEQKTFVDIIKRSVGRINILLSDFLNSYNGDEIHSEVCSMNELLEEVLILNKDRLLLKKVMIVKEYASRYGKILVNKEEIKIALTNIIINAIEAMPSEKGTLKLGTRLSNDKCIIEIEDNGVGISEKNLKTIFDPNFTNKPGGMGLGLSTTLDILLSNCATLDVQSEEGSGTRFTLYFNKMGKRT
jgi:signal transduction histidine kinase